MPPPARKPPVVEEEILADFESAELVSEAPAAEAEPMEFELEELGAEAAGASTEVDFEEEVAAEAAASTATKLDPEDSDWSLGAEIREEEPREATPHNRNDDSFDLRSLALEIDEEPDVVEESELVEEAPVEVAEVATSAAKDDDDLDALFEEIQIGD